MALAGFLATLSVRCASKLALESCELIPPLGCVHAHVFLHTCTPEPQDGAGETKPLTITHLLAALFHTPEVKQKVVASPDEVLGRQF